MLRFHATGPGAAPPDGVMTALPARALIPPAMAMDQGTAAALGRVPDVPGTWLPDKARKGVEGPAKGAGRTTRPFRRRIATEELEARALEAAGTEAEGDTKEPGRRVPLVGAGRPRAQARAGLKMAGQALDGAPPSSTAPFDPSVGKPDRPSVRVTPDARVTKVLAVARARQAAGLVPRYG